MLFSSSSRVRVAILSLISLLFMQVSVAAYACPAGLKDAMQMEMGSDQPMADAVQDTTTEVDDSMEGCPGMNADRPPLCHAHCHGQTVSADVSFPPPLTLPALDVLGTGDFEQSVRSGASPAKPVDTPLLARLLAPPDRILHCCLIN